jgi:hypothetical protein
LRCSCGLMYPACNAREQYCHLWPLRLYQIIPHYLINDTIFGEGVTEHKMCFDFHYNFPDHTQKRTTVGRLLWTSDQLVAEASTSQHTTLTGGRHPCPQRDSNPNLNSPAAAYLRLRPRGKWGRISNEMGLKPCCVQSRINMEQFLSLAWQKMMAGYVQIIQS